jgi:O-antigen ligase
MLAMAGFVVLACRFLIVASRSADSSIAFGLIVAGTAILTAYKPIDSFVAVTLLLPLVFGLGRAGLLAVLSPELVMFCAFGLTFVIQAAMRPAMRRAMWGEIELFGGWPTWFLAIVDLLAIWTVISFAWWLTGRIEGGNVHSFFLTQGTFNYSDPLFPVSDALFWVTSWFYLRLLLFIACGTQKAADGSDPGNSPMLGTIAGPWLKGIILSWTLWMAVFLLIQLILKVPDGFDYNMAFSIPTGMFHDPHSMGSVAASAGFGLFAAACGLRFRSASVLSLLAVLLMVIVGISYSRAAWFAAIASLLLLSFAWRPRLATALTVFMALVIGMLAWRADDIIKLNHRYLTRVVYLVRLDRLSENHEARLEVYRRAPAMIAAHPFLGHGPGSSRVASIAYVSKNDTWGPDFLHNAVLQVAVEQGIPAAIFFALILVLPIAAAARNWRAIRGDPLTAGAAFAVVSYLLTQLTSNSLNIYVDQQFYFWSCMCILVVRLSQQGIGLQHRPPQITSRS